MTLAWTTLAALLLVCASFLAAPAAADSSCPDTDDYTYEVGSDCGCYRRTDKLPRSVALRSCDTDIGEVYLDGQDTAQMVIANAPYGVGRLWTSAMWNEDNGQYEFYNGTVVANDGVALTQKDDADCIVFYYSSQLYGRLNCLEEYRAMCKMGVADNCASESSGTSVCYYAGEFTGCEDGTSDCEIASGTTLQVTFEECQDSCLTTTDCEAYSFYSIFGVTSCSLFTSGAVLEADETNTLFVVGTNTC